MFELHRIASDLKSHLTGGAEEVKATGGARPTTAPDFGAPDAIDKVAAAAISSFFGNTGLLKADIEDYRSVEAAERAMSEPLALPEGSKPFGDTVVYRPGLANPHPSPAFIFRTARYTDRLLIAYGNAKPGQDLAPRPVNELYGVPVPDELKGRIFVSGDEANRMIPWQEGADLLERQLNALDGSDFLKGRDVDGANVTVLAYSAGGADAADARRSLEADGRHGVIGTLVNLGSPMRGTPVSDEAFFGLAAKALQITGGRAPKAARAFDPDTMRRAFSDREQRLVDLAVTSSVDEGLPGADNARPLMKLMAKAFRLNPFNRFRGGPSDGWVHTESMRFGKEIYALPRSYDHAGLAEDPRVVDDIARRLAGRR